MLTEAGATCDTTGIKFSAYDNEQVEQDVQVIFSRNFLPTVSGYPYMDSPRLNLFLRVLDLDVGLNEFGLPVRDYELIYNYFHAGDSTSYYGTFGVGNPRMQFFRTDTTAALTERNHVDLYLRHYQDPGYQYDHYPSDVTDIQEDPPFADCTEYHANSVSAAVGFHGAANPSDPCSATITADATWYLGGKHANVRVDHETTHLIAGSGKLSGSNTAFEVEHPAVAAEYIAGAWARDGDGPSNNVIYDRPLLGDMNAISTGAGYSHWYMWAAYLMQQFAGDSTRIEDDLYYKWMRWNIGPTGLHGDLLDALANVLDDDVAYGSFNLGATGSERLGNIFANYSVAKWLDRADPSFYGGKYGFARGVDPYRYPGIFGTGADPAHRATAKVVPPQFAVGKRHSRVSCGSEGGVWCVSDSAQGCNQDQIVTTCDSIRVAVWSSDYLVFDADPDLDDGQIDTLHVVLSWNPALYPRLNGTGYRGALRVFGVTYAMRSDSLYRQGSEALNVYEAQVDTLQGRCDLFIPDFGGLAKAATVVISLGQEYPKVRLWGSVFQYPLGLSYSYRFGVLPRAVPRRRNLDLIAFRTSPSGRDSLEWSLPSDSIATAFYVQRAVGDKQQMVTIDTTPGCTSAVSYAKVFGNDVVYYRVISQCAASDTSNVATPGGVVDGAKTIDGDLYISGDVSVPQGATLTVSPGTRIRVRPNADSQGTGYDAGKVEMLIDGAINAIGTSGDSITWSSAALVPSPGDWKGIRLDLASADTSSHFAFCVVGHAYHGIQTSGSPRLHHCRIEHSQFYGLYVQWGAPWISYSVFQQNHGAEIGAVFYAAPVIRNNVLRYDATLGAGAVDDGAVYSVSGGGRLRLNDITGVGMGVYCVGSGSNPLLAGEGQNADSLMYGRNNILDFHNYGVRTYDGARPELGKLNPSTNPDAGRNNIYTNADTTALYVSHAGPAEMNARHNYWGSSPPDLSKFSGPIDGPQQSNRYLSSYETEAGAGFLPASGFQGSEGIYAEALQKEIDGDDSGAAAAYRQIVAEYPDAPDAVGALSRLVAMRCRSGDLSDDLTYLTSLSQSATNPEVRSLARRLYPQVLMRVGRREEAFEAYEAVLQSGEFDRPGLLLELAMQKAFVGHDAMGALDAIKALQRSTSDAFLLKHARAMLEEVVGPDAWKGQRLDQGAGAAASPAGTAVLALGQSNPNPMNPSTVITYSLPHAGRATLRVFDVRGRAVRTLSDSPQDEGWHRIVWNGRNDQGAAVASGVYYYRLQFEDQFLSRKLIVLK